jgi:hypothetical protein
MMSALDGDYCFEVMAPEAYRGMGTRMINIRQEWPSLTDGDVFMRVVIHERDAEALCEAIMRAALEARKG